MQRLIPTIRRGGDASALAEFYAAALPGAARTPDGDIEVGGFRIALVDAPSPHDITPAVSFFLNFSAGETDLLDETYAKLADGGATLMPLQEYDFSPRFAWVADKFGVNWQLMVGERDERLTPCLLFAGAAYGRARAATERYVSTFPDSRVVIQPESGDIVYSEIDLLGQRVVVQESPPHQFTFADGLALHAAADDQAELDTWSARLGAAPDAEGYLTDEFGLTWRLTASEG